MSTSRPSAVDAQADQAHHQEYEIEIEHDPQDGGAAGGYQQQEAPAESSSYQYEAKEAYANSPPKTARASDFQHHHHHQQYPPRQHVPRPPPAPSAGAAQFDVHTLDAAAHAAIESDEEQVVSEFMQLLEAHREECERKCLYVEASLAKQKLDDLRAHEESRRRSALAVRHIAERLELEEAHILEFDEFNALWAEKIFREFDQQTQAKQKAMLLRHVDALEQWTSAEQDRIFLRPKFSKQLLQLRSMQEQFARARDYSQAERVKVQADSLEALELDTLKGKWMLQIESRRQKFLYTQRQEIEGYVRRRAYERRQLDQRRLHELRSEIIQKYKNLKSALEVAQAKERAKADKMRELGVSGSLVLREQAPKHRNHSSAAMYASIAADGSRPASVASTNQYGRTRVQSSAMKQEAQRRRIEAEEEEMLRAGEEEQLRMQQESPADPLDGDGDQQRSQGRDIPTIAGAMNSARGGGYGQSGSSTSRRKSAPGMAGGGVSQTPRAGGAGGNGQNQPSGTSLLARTQPRANTSHAYDPSGRRPIVSRTYQPAPNLHWSRPPTRSANSRDRQKEMDGVLAPPTGQLARAAMAGGGGAVHYGRSRSTDGAQPGSGHSSGGTSGGSSNGSNSAAYSPKHAQSPGVRFPSGPMTIPASGPGGLPNVPSAIRTGVGGKPQRKSVETLKASYANSNEF